jgi:hypothetical protein
MNIVILKPYEGFSGQTFLEETKCIILKENFDDVNFIDGRITISIENCDFKKLVIENSEETDFNVSTYISQVVLLKVYKSKP